MVTGDGRTARLSVHDTGVGMTPYMIERVFDLFFQGERTLERAEGGLGIGLTLVRRLAELHGGRVAAREPGPGRGSTVTVELPQCAAPRTRPRPPPRRAAPPRGARPVVEDSQDSRDMLRFLLEHAGHEVHEAEDGPRGVEAIVAMQARHRPGGRGPARDRRLRGGPPRARADRARECAWWPSPATGSPRTIAARRRRASTRTS